MSAQHQSDESISLTIGAIYDVAVAPERWPVLLGQLRNLFGVVFAHRNIVILCVPMATALPSGLRKPGSFGESSPLKFNPFQPYKKISPGTFTGRSEEINAIVQSLHQTKHGNPQHFLIERERGIGKSSLLFLISSIASGQIHFSSDPIDFLVLQVDLGGVATQHDIVRAIARQLKSELSRLKNLEETAKAFWSFLLRNGKYLA